MKVFLEVPYGLSRAMSRVANALTLYAPPEVETVMRVKDADVVLLHVIGYPETAHVVGQLRATGQRYILVQYCLKTTQRPDTDTWRPLWAGAEVVWSYYNLAGLVRADGGEADFNSYLSPLGVDSWSFSPTQDASARGFTAMTSGYVADSECVYEVAEAVRRTGGQHYHLGPRLEHLGVGTMSELGISDARLAEIYRSTRYVSGLRRVEGFELPAAEGLVCGARPILFDQPAYRQWFDPWAVFIPEGDERQVIDSVTDVLMSERPPVSFSESTAAAERFDWATIAGGFWQAVGVGDVARAM